MIGTAESEKAGPVSQQPSQESSEADQPHGFEVDAVEPMVLLAPDGGNIYFLNCTVHIDNRQFKIILIQ